MLNLRSIIYKFSCFFTYYQHSHLYLSLFYKTLGKQVMVPELVKQKSRHQCDAKYIESINYVLPVEHFGDFKVILPKTKLELKTLDGSKMVVGRNNLKNTSSLNVFSADSGCLKQTKSSLSILQVLTQERINSQLKGVNKDEKIRCMKKKMWDKRNNNYVYYYDKRKFVIDSETGNISCYRQHLSRSRKCDVVPSSELTNGNNLDRRKTECLLPNSYSINSYFIQDLSSRYKSTSSSVKRVTSELNQRGRLMLKRLKTTDAFEKQ